MAQSIYLMRHGDAHNVGQQGIMHDVDRTLTEAGIEKLKLAAIGFKRLGEHIDRCYSSPLIRAYQTAQIMTEPFGLSEQIERVEGLGNMPNFQQVFQLIRETPEPHVLLTGHTPFMGELLSRLVCQQPYAGLAFSKGTVARVDLHALGSDLRGQLRFYIRTEQLQTLGRQES